MQADISKTLSDFRYVLWVQNASLCVAMTYVLNMQLTSRNIALITIERETFMPRCSSANCILCLHNYRFLHLVKESCIFDQKNLPVFHLCTILLPFVPPVSLTFRFLHILTTGRALSFAYLLLPVYDKKTSASWCISFLKIEHLNKV